MTYLGRICGLGKTSEGNVAAVYALSVRQPINKERQFIIAKEGFVKKVEVAPLAKRSRALEENPQIFFHDALICSPNLNGQGPYVVTGNGRHIEPIFELSSVLPLSDGKSSAEIVADTLGLYGPVRDELKTPKIAAACFLNANNAVFGITTESFNARSQIVELVDNGEFVLLSTYDGTDDNTPKPTSYSEALRRTNFVGKSPLELAVEFFDWVDPKVVVATAAAVYDRRGWDLAVKNANDAEATNGRGE
jgi:IMP cyclohydrolase